jgi:hypothetical protein
MYRLLKAAIALAIVVSGSSWAGNPTAMRDLFSGGLRLFAKETPHIRVAVESIPPELTSNGANMEAVRNQVEVAMRRCGFTIVPKGKAKGMLYVAISGLSHEGRGYSGNVHIDVSMGELVRGEFVFIEAWSDEMVIAGPPGDASMRIRDVLAGFLDQFCNFYLQARDEVRGKTGK